MFPFLWKGADGVVAFEPCCEMHSWNMVCQRPPRLRRIRRLRGIFLYGAATPPHEADPYTHLTPPGRPESLSRRSPLLVRRGGRAINKWSLSLKGADGVVAFEPV